MISKNIELGSQPEEIQKWKMYSTTLMVCNLRRLINDNKLSKSQALVCKLYSCISKFGYINFYSRVIIKKFKSLQSRKKNLQVGLMMVHLKVFKES